MTITASKGLSLETIIGSINHDFKARLQFESPGDHDQVTDNQLLSQDDDNSDADDEDDEGSGSESSISDNLAQTTASEDARDSFLFSRTTGPIHIK